VLSNLNHKRIQRSWLPMHSLDALRHCSLGVVESEHDPVNVCLTSRHETMNWCRNQRLCRLPAPTGTAGIRRSAPRPCALHLTSTSTCRAVEMETFGTVKTKLTVSLIEFGSCSQIWNLTYQKDFGIRAVITQDYNDDADHF
jgi:hypothetical protein